MATTYLTYREKLQDPRWQRKRLEVMQRSGFSCAECFSKDKTLNVHHGYYEKGLDPWDYPDDTLHCLCSDCHSQAESARVGLLRLIGQFDTQFCWHLWGYAAGLLWFYRFGNLTLNVAPADSAAHVAAGLADYFRISVDLVRSALRPGNSIDLSDLNTARIEIEDMRGDGEGI